MKMSKQKPCYRCKNSSIPHDHIKGTGPCKFVRYPDNPFLINFPSQVCHCSDWIWPTKKELEEHNKAL
jgi:hypothetical protein